MWGTRDQTQVGHTQGKLSTNCAITLIPTFDFSILDILPTIQYEHLIFPCSILTVESSQHSFTVTLSKSIFGV